MTAQEYIRGMFDTLAEIDQYSEQLDKLMMEGKITTGARWYLLCPHNEYFYNAFFKALGRVHNSNIKGTQNTKALNIASKYWWKAWYESAQKFLKVIQHTVETENFDLDWDPN